MTARRAWSWSLVLIASAALVRVLLAGLVPLYPDETYYWEWSRRPAFGYFDHPPGIAILIGAGTALFGDTALAVRAGPLLAGAFATLAAVALADRLGGGHSALRAAAILTALPLAAAGLLLATPDAPLLLASAITLLAVQRALEAEPGSGTELSWWAVVGLATGLGFGSKLSGVLIPAGVAVAMLLRADLRIRLRTPGPWLAVVLSSLVLGPFVSWNSRNEWISFRFQIEHGLEPAAGSPVLRLVEVVGGQMGLASPILFALLAWASARALRDADPRRFLLGVTAVFVFGFFALSALRGSFEQNWPAPAYVPALVLLATERLGRTGIRWYRWGVALGAVVILAVYLQALTPWLPLAALSDPAARAFGWDAVARDLHREQVETRSAGCPAVWLEARTYQHASLTAFHLPKKPYVHANNLASRANQYDFWHGFADLAEREDCLILFGTEPGTALAAQRLSAVFERVEESTPIVRRRAGRPVEELRVWRLVGWSGDDTPFRKP